MSEDSNASGAEKLDYSRDHAAAAAQLGLEVGDGSPFETIGERVVVAVLPPPFSRKAYVSFFEGGCAILTDLDTDDAFLGLLAKGPSDELENRLRDWELVDSPSLGSSSAAFANQVTAGIRTLLLGEDGAVEAPDPAVDPLGSDESEFLAEQAAEIADDEAEVAEILDDDVDPTAVAAELDDPAVDPDAGGLRITIDQSRFEADAKAALSDAFGQVKSDVAEALAAASDGSLTITFLLTDGAAVSAPEATDG